MKQEGHLQTFTLTLKTTTPVFIGCGKSYNKKEYIFDEREQTAAFVDEELLFSFLVKNRLVDAYEQYMLGNRWRGLKEFLLDNRVPQSQINKLIRCRIDARDALDESHSLKEIQRLVRDGQGRVYVPGSSIKGVLRTVLLKSMLLENPPVNSLSLNGKDAPEERWLHTLSLKPDVRNPLNSIMQGIRVSDSLPIEDDAMCLSRKIDTFRDGGVNKLNLCRECIQPGTEIHCVLTLDQSVLQGKITCESILSAIARVSEYYQATVTRKYPYAPNDLTARTILLGGGVGFQSKTVTDSIYGTEALQVTSEILSKSFSAHHHGKDVREGISPRALKQTVYKKAAYTYGACEVFLQ